MITDAKEIELRGRKAVVTGEKLGSRRYLFTAVCEGKIRQLEVVVGDDKGKIENHTIETFQAGINSARAQVADLAVTAAEHHEIEGQID